jgi:hypothetical protein
MRLSVERLLPKDAISQMLIEEQQHELQKLTSTTSDRPRRDMTHGFLPLRNPRSS